MPDDSTQHTQHIDELTRTLVPIFARASIGDFSQDVVVPSQENDLTSLYVGIQIMLQVIREKVANLESANRQLQERVVEKIALLRSIGDGVVVLDTQDNVTFLNPSGEHLTGWQEKEVIGKKWSECVPLLTLNGTLIDPSLRPLSTARGVSSPAAEEVDYYYGRKDGSRFPVDATVSPVLVDEQKAGTVVVFRDITSEKQVEELKDDFLSLATHQLRDPLTTMRWTLDSLLADPVIISLSENVKKKIENVYKSNLHMIELVNDILSVSRIGQSNIKEHQEPRNIGQILRAIMDAMQLEARHAGVTLKLLDLDAVVEEAHYLLDQSLLTHCVENIISNAIKYSRVGGEVSVRAGEKEGKVFIEVQDHGIGIPAGDVSHIFERFYRGKNVLDLDSPGSGLGLFVVHSLVSYWGGVVEFQSEEGVGTTMTLRIPYKKVE